MGVPRGCSETAGGTTGADAVFPAIGGQRPRDLPPMDEVAGCSATRSQAAALTMALVAAALGDGDGDRPRAAWDAFGGAGADAIALMLSGVVRNVVVSEVHAPRAQAIWQRMTAYARLAGSRSPPLAASAFEVHVEDSTHAIGARAAAADVVFMDPPWGGPAYRGAYEVAIQVGCRPLGHWVAEAKATHRQAQAQQQQQQQQQRIVVCKLPYNYAHARDAQVAEGAAAIVRITRSGRADPVFDLVVHATDAAAARRRIQTLHGLTNAPYVMHCVPLAFFSGGATTPPLAKSWTRLRAGGSPTSSCRPRCRAPPSN
jgi:16S rRNA G966 N2-methylase RsmD